MHQQVPLPHEEQQTSNEQPITWDAIKQKEFIEFAENTKTVIEITNWKLYQKSELDFNDKTKEVLRKYFEADVVSHNGAPCKKVLRTSGILLLTALKPHLETKDNTQKVKLEVFRTGIGKLTKYVISCL